MRHEFDLSGDDQDPIRERRRFNVDVGYKGNRMRMCGGVFLPLRYRTNTHEKSKLEEAARPNKSRYQGRGGAGLVGPCRDEIVGVYWDMAKQDRSQRKM